MSVILWLVGFVAVWPVTALAVILAPLAAALADPTTGRLPPSLWWMETPDEPLPGARYEPGHRAKIERFGFRVASCLWLWRNMAYNWACCFRYVPHPRDLDAMTARGPLNVGAEVPGLTLYRIGHAWEIYFARPIFGRYGPRIRLGWKLQPFFRVPRDQWPEPGRVVWGMWTCSIAPLHRFDFRAQ